MDGSNYWRLWGLLTTGLPFFFFLILTPRFCKLNNFDVEVWALRGMVTIIIITLLSMAPPSFPLLGALSKSWSVWLLIAAASTCAIDFGPRRCKPVRKITNVSAIFPVEDSGDDGSIEEKT